MKATALAVPVDARVIQTPHGFKVVPDYVFKHTHDGFTLLNLTDFTVHVSFPKLRTNPTEGDVPPGEAETFTIEDTPPGTYQYWVQIVFREETLKLFMLRASGGSDPNIIIDF